MTKSLFAAPAFMLLLITACVTVNIYFPAAAAEKVADEIIEGIQNEQEHNTPSESESSIGMPSLSRLIDTILGFSISNAQAAEANLSIDTAEIRAIRARMTQRFTQLNLAYSQGYIGIVANGLLSVRAPGAVPLKDRNKIQQLVAAENKDRASLYQAIAVGNGHPDWAASIKATFAKRWIGNARSGWWYQVNGAWTQK